MIDWETTATTILCQFVEDEVTIIVNSDGTVKCSGRQRYEKPSRDVKKALRDKSRAAGRNLACLGDKCPSLTLYKEKWLGEK